MYMKTGAHLAPVFYNPKYNHGNKYNTKSNRQ